MRLSNFPRDYYRTWRVGINGSSGIRAFLRNRKRGRTVATFRAFTSRKSSCGKVDICLARTVACRRNVSTASLSEETATVVVVEEKREEKERKRKKGQEAENVVGSDRTSWKGFDTPPAGKHHGEPVTSGSPAFARVSHVRARNAHLLHCIASFICLYPAFSLRPISVAMRIYSGRSRWTGTFANATNYEIWRFVRNSESHLTSTLFTCLLAEEEIGTCFSLINSFVNCCYSRNFWRYWSLNIAANV